MIKAIIFDYFGVLSSDEFFRRVRASGDDTAAFDTIAQQVNIGDISWDKFCKGVAEMSDLDENEVHQQYNRLQLNASLIAVIAELKSTYKIGLITNASAGFIEPILQSAGLTALFDSVVVSSSYHIAKPQKEIYLESARQLAVATEECVFIDDNQANVTGAEAVGMQAIQYTTTESLLDEFSKIL